MLRIVHYLRERSENVCNANRENEVNQDWYCQKHAACEEPQLPAQQLRPLEDERNAEEHQIHNGKLCQHERLTQHDTSKK